MKRVLNYVFISLLLLLGVAHTALTPVFFKNFDESFLWFAGTGLSFVFLAFLNYARVLTTLFSIRIMCAIGNLFGLLFVICLINTGEAITLQAFVSLIVLFTLFLLSLYNFRQSQ